VFGKSEKGQQLGQIALQLPDHGCILASPAPAEGTGGGHGLAAAVSQIDGLGIGLDLVVIAFARLLQDVAHLVHPATGVEQR